MTSDMTMAEVLRDPLIRQVLRADGIAPSAFAATLRLAAKKAAEEAAATVPRSVN